VRRAAAIALTAMSLPAVAAGGGIDRPLAGAGDPARGKAIVIARESNCVLCHDVPGAGIASMGNVGPALAGVASRVPEALLRERIVDSSRLNPETLMPSYHRVDGLHRVPRELRGRPVLSAQQVEDVVAFLRTLH
jgi:sulfur-oxidizing protein SoxX